MLGARAAPDGTVLDTFTISGAFDDQVGPRLAFDGDNYLATWSDRRERPEPVYYTRIAQDGTPLDPDGRRLPPRESTAIQFSPVPASNGSGFLVAWLASCAGYVVSAARLRPDGEPLDSTAIRSTPDSVFQWSVALGTDGDNYLVVWSGEAPGTESTALCCSRLSVGGAILDPVPIAVTRSLADVADLAVAYLDGTYLITWTDWRADGDIHACRVRQDGTVLDSGGFAVYAKSGMQHQPAVVTGSSSAGPSSRTARSTATRPALIRATRWVSAGRCRPSVRPGLRFACCPIRLDAWCGSRPSDPDRSASSTAGAV